MTVVGMSMLLGSQDKSIIGQLQKSYLNAFCLNVSEKFSPMWSLISTFSKNDLNPSPWKTQYFLKTAENSWQNFSYSGQVAYLFWVLPLLCTALLGGIATLALFMEGFPQLPATVLTIFTLFLLLFMVAPFNPFFLAPLTSSKATVSTLSSPLPDQETLRQHLVRRAPKAVLFSSPLFLIFIILCSVPIKDFSFAQSALTLYNDLS